MSLSISGSKSKSKSSTTANAATTALFNPLFSQAQSLNSQQFTPYTGQLSQGMTADQTGARSLLQQGQGQDATRSAINSAQGAAGYVPSQISAQSFAGSDMSPYMNPYTSQVVDQTLADINRQREIAMTGQAGQFTSQGAFGGSRHGVADALTNEAYGRQAAMTSAQLRSQGYDNATGLLNNDINRNMQVQQANQSAGLQGNSQQLQAAGLLGNLGQQQQSMGLLDANALNTFGTQQQENQQQALDRQYQQYLLQQGYTQQQIENNMGLLGSIPNMYAGASTQGSGSQIGFSASASYPGQGGK